MNRALAYGFAGLLALGGASACGGDNGSGADAAPTGPCVRSSSLSMPWPSEADPQFCMRAWDNTKPAAELTECGDVFENCSGSGTAPDFACIDNPPGQPPATPDTVTLTGYVDVFSSGPNSNQARIQVFRQTDLDGVTDITTATPIATQDIVLDMTTLAEARACPKERSFISENQVECTPPDPDQDCAGGCDKLVNAGQFCFDGTCHDLQRWEITYSIPNIPTNEFLVIRTVGLDDQGNPQPTGNTWAPMLQYNAYFATNDPACVDTEDRDCIDTSGTPAIYRSDANLISAQDYMTIPTSAGLSGGIPPGHGAVGGEIHDCNGIRITHAQIGYERDREPGVVTYFNGNPVKTLPRLQQFGDGTNSLSLFSGLDLSPGPVDIVAVGVHEGALKEMGRFRAQVWPDSVTLVRLGGGRPARP